MTSFPHHQIPTTSFVGRQTEIAALDGMLTRVATGAGQTYLIMGEAGIGKSRFVGEVRTMAYQRGFSLVQGACVEGDRALPYALGRELARASLRSGNAHQGIVDLQPYADLIVWLLPELAGQFPLGVARMAQTDDPEQTKRRIFQFLIDVIDSMPSPQVVIAEDVHWADDLSLEWLLLLARRTMVRSHALLITIRSDEIHPALRHFLAELERQRLGTELPLARFSSVETKRMIALMFNQERVRNEFVEAIQLHTDGNPFFIEETLRTLAASGDIFRDRDGWSRKPLEALRIPRTVDDAVQRRLSQLSAPAREVLVMAAVLGRRFDLQVLEYLFGHALHMLLTLIKELIAAGLVHEVLPQRPGEEESFAFHHALTQRAILASLLARERRLLHRQILRAIEVVHARRHDQLMADLAWHAFAAGLWQQAHLYSSRAGEDALALLAPAAAIEHLSHALEAIDHGAADSSSAWVPTRITLLRQRARAYELRNQFAQACTDHETILREAQELGDRQHVWQSLFDLGFLWTGHNMEHARVYLEQALDAARSMNDPVLLGQSLNRIGNWYVNMGDPARALAQHTQAHALFISRQDEPNLAVTEDFLGITNLIQGDFLAGMQHYTRAIAGFRSTNNDQGLVSALATSCMLGGALQVNTVVPAPQAHAEALRLADEAIQLTQDLHWPMGEANAHAYLALAMCERGDYRQAFAHGEAALNIAAEIDAPAWELVARMALGGALTDLLDYSAADAQLHAACALADQLGALEWRYMVAGPLVRVRIRQQRLHDAEQTLTALPTLSFSSAQSVGKRLYWCAQAALALANRQPQAALDLLDALIDSAPHTSTGAIIPRLWLLRAEALQHLRRFDAAERTFCAAEAAAQQYEHWPVLWQVQISLAVFYRGRRRVEQAQAYVQTARTTVQRFVAGIPDATLRELFLRQFEALLADSRPPTALRAAKHAYDGLTARERQVAALVAAGMSNRAIAERLTVSERTIEKHVEHALAKRMFTSRAQLAVWAVERGLRAEST